MIAIIAVIQFEVFVRLGCCNSSDVFVKIDCCNSIQNFVRLNCCRSIWSFERLECCRSILSFCKTRINSIVTWNFVKTWILPTVQFEVFVRHWCCNSHLKISFHEISFVRLDFLLFNWEFCKTLLLLFIVKFFKCSIVGIHFKVFVKLRCCYSIIKFLRLGCCQ